MRFLNRYGPYDKVHRINVWAWRMPGYLHKNPQKRLFQQFCTKITRVDESSIFSEDIATSKCFWQSRQHMSMQHFLVNSAIHFHSFFNEYQGRFHFIRRNSIPNLDTSFFWKVYWHFWNVSWCGYINHIVLRVDHSLYIEKSLVRLNEVSL